MSVVHVAEAAEEWLDHGPPWTCLTCGEPVWPPAVYWQGALQQVFLHDGCALQLGMHLMGDSREVTLATNPEPRWRRRAVAAVRHRLQSREAAA